MNAVMRRRLLGITSTTKIVLSSILIMPFFQPPPYAKQVSRGLMKREVLQVREFVLVVELALPLYPENTIENLRVSCLHVRAIQVVGAVADGYWQALIQLEPP
jgi:hypothetical protein